MQTGTAEKETELPTFEVIDQPKWDDIKAKLGINWYGKSVAEFVARWAALMETEIAKGASVAICAESTAIALDTEMQTADNVYGYAIEILSQVWKHGATLKAHYGI